MDYFSLLINNYGTPSLVDYSSGGFAVWNKNKLKNTCFHKIELLDESVPHCVPKPHRDFLYTYVKYEVPKNRVLDVLSLSGSVSYDPLKKLLRARCGSEEANIATLYLATGIGNGKASINKIHNENLYKKTIVSTLSESNVHMYYKKLCEHLKNQPGNPKWTGYFPLAFPEGCCKGYNPKKNKCDIEKYANKNNHHVEHTLKDHLSGKITDHSIDQHLEDKSDKADNINNVDLQPVLI